MIWDESKNEISIEWIEPKGGRQEVHVLKKSPLRLQLHPITGEVIRAHIKGPRPSWIVKYAKQKIYRTHETTTSEGKGWWIANWANYPMEDRPLLCPFIKGMIEEWFEKLPEECQKDKEALLKHIKIVEANLMYHHAEFSQWGLHFRPEEILLDGGALVLDKCLLPKETEDEIFQLSDWPEYQRVVQSLQDVREIPDTAKLIARFDEVEDEPFVLELPAPQEEFLEGEEMLFEEEEELITSEGEEIVNLDVIDEEELVLPGGNLTDINIETQEEFEQEEEFTGPSYIEKDVMTPPDNEIEVNDNRQETVVSIVQPEKTRMVVATKRCKKESIVVGQTLLF